MLTDLYHQMIKISENLDNPALLKSLGYCEIDRDCGYRSSLKFLRMERDVKTDAIANHVIYRRHEKITDSMLSYDCVQLCLEI